MDKDIIYIELDEELKPNEVFKGVITIREGEKIGLIGVAEVWETTSHLETKYVKIKVCE